MVVRIIAQLFLVMAKSLLHLIPNPKRNLSEHYSKKVLLCCNKQYFCNKNQFNRFINIIFYIIKGLKQTFLMTVS